MTAWKLSTKTGNAYIDGVLGGTKWDATAITYGFPASFSDYVAKLEDYEYSKVLNPDGTTKSSVNELRGFSPVSEGIKTAAIAAMDSLRGITQLGVTRIDTGLRDATITLGQTTAAEKRPAYASNPAYANSPNDVRPGDIFFQSGSFDRAAPGTFEWVTAWHEIGHALGLKHPHDTGGTVMPLDRDGLEFTIMSYRSVTGSAATGYKLGADYPQGWMMYDIAALQHLYGPDYGFNGGSTVYTFNKDTGEMSVNGAPQGRAKTWNGTAYVDYDILFRTIWDGGGRDTYDFSTFTTKLSVDLTPGGWSDLHVGGTQLKAATDESAALVTGWTYAKGHVYNALKHGGSVASLIENAKAGSNDDTVLGNEVANTLWGNGGNDRLFGEAGNDVLYGGLANDSLYGGLGNDVLNGGAGADMLLGGGDFDTASYFDSPLAVWVDLQYNGGQGGHAAGDTYGSIEQVVGSAFADQIFGTDWGPEWIYGGRGNDRLFGRDGNDVLLGEDGDDELAGGWGADALYGGNGFDTASYAFAAGPVTINLATGVQTGEAAGDTFSLVEAFAGTAAADTFVGSALGQLFVGNGGDDALYGMGGDDTLRGGAGYDRLEGGEGFDMASYLDAPSYVVGDLDQDLGNGIRGKVTGGDYGDTLISIEDLQGSRFGDTLYGTATSNKFLGDEGNDTIDGRGGEDIAYGEGGDDVVHGHANDFWLDGGTGFDTLVLRGATSFLNFNTSSFILDSGYLYNLRSFESVVGTGGLDWMAAGGTVVALFGMGGNDALMAAAAGTTLSGGAGADQLIGGAGFDTADYGGDTVGVLVDLRSSVYLWGEAAGDTSSSVEGLSGGAGNDRLGGTEDRNILAGRAGNDYLAGYGGNDTIYGDAGNDSVDGGLGADRIEGGDNDDVLGDAEQAVLKSALRDTAADALFGGAGNDTLMSTGGADSLDGGAGVDLLVFSAPTGAVLSFTASPTAAWSLAQGATGTARVVGFERLDITGGAGADRMNAAAMQQGVVLRGGAGGDSLTGGAGADLIAPGSGINRATGGAGADRFLFDAPPTAAGIADGTLTTITDFLSGLDRIEVSRAAFVSPTGLSLGALAAQTGRFASNTTGLATGAGPQFVYETDARTLWWDVDGTGTAARQIVATLSAGAIAAGDIWVV